MKKLVLISIMLMSWIARADQPATHGMVIFGDKVTYASHLPMFHAPHDYQLILQINVAGAAASAYEKAKETSGPEIFTLVPEKMDLTKLISGEKTSFQATVVQGHFEKGGKDLGSVEITIEKIIYLKKLDPTQSGPESSKRVYQDHHIVFGSEGEYFAAHLISSNPSFDSILKVAHPYFLKEMHCRTRACSEPKVLPMSDSDLPSVFSKWVFNGPAVPLKKGDFLNSPMGSASNKITEVLEVIYFEDADLKH